MFYIGTQMVLVLSFNVNMKLYSYNLWLWASVCIIQTKVYSDWDWSVAIQ